MNKVVIKSALLGAVVVFLWGFISWMVLPLHQRCFKKFACEAEMAREIKKSAPVQGMYVLPYTFSYDENTSSEQLQQAISLMETGPFVFASVVPNGLGLNMKMSLVKGFLIQLAAALIICWMLSCTKGLSFSRQILFVTLFGLGAGILGNLPSWNWLGFSLDYVLLNLLDLVIGWGLAGWVIAAYLNKRKTRA